MEIRESINNLIEAQSHLEDGVSGRVRVADYREETRPILVDQIIALVNQWLKEQGAKHRVCIQVTETGPVDGATTIVTRDEPLRIPSPE